jgi:hypothetical protein
MGMGVAVMVMAGAMVMAVVVGMVVRHGVDVII